MERAGFIRARNTIRKVAAELRTQVSEENIEEGPKVEETSLKKMMEEEEWERMRGYVSSLGGELGQWEEHDEEDINNRLITSATPDISFKDCYGWSLLHFAADSHPIDTLHRLLILRADPNATNCLGRTPLHIAVMKDDSEAVAELLQYGGNPNIGDLDGWTSVHFAVHLRSVKSLTTMCGFLLDFEAVNKEGKTPKDYVESETVRGLIFNYEQRKVESIRTHDSLETTADVSFSTHKYSSDAIPFIPFF